MNVSLSGVSSHLETPVPLFFGKCSTLIWQTSLTAAHLLCASMAAAFLIKSGQWSFHYEEKEGGLGVYTSLIYVYIVKLGICLRHYAVKMRLRKSVFSRVNDILSCSECIV